MLKTFILVLMLLGFCGCTMPVEEDDMSKNQNMKNVTASATAVMHTRQNPAFTSGLQVAHLEPGEYTLQFGLIPPAPVGGVEQVVSAQAIINWKADNQQQRRVVSIIPGMSISGVAEAVDVSIQDLGSLFGLNSAGQEYKIPITLAKGLRGNIQQPPVLLSGTGKDVAPGGVAGFPVPRDSGVVAMNILLAPQLNTPMISSDAIAVQQSNATSVSIHYPLMENGWIPLLPGVSNVVIGNNSAAATFTVNVVWGIEG